MSFEFDCASFIKTHYNLSGKISQQVGEVDLNFHVYCKETEKHYLVKVHSLEDIELIRLQEYILSHLNGIAELIEPMTIPSTSGESIIEIAEKNKIVRVLTWIEGSLWSSMKTVSDSMYFELGRAVAIVDEKLNDIKINKSQMELLNRPYVWNVMQTQSNKLLDQINLIQDDNLRQVIGNVLQFSENEVLPKLNLLPHQIIHNDANDNNIIIGFNSDTRNYFVRSIIDFGDVIYSPKICGLSVACAYVIHHENEGENIIHEVKTILSGYNSIYPLTKPEYDLLFHLIRLRVATSIVISHIQHKENPQNDYLNISQVNFRKLIHVLTHDNFFSLDME